MTTEFNYVARLDTTQIMSGLAEIRSQVGMAFGSPTGFQSPAMSIAGGGSDFSSGVAQHAQQMFAGLQSPPSFGGTFTNPAMAYSPHYGMIQAETSLDQEWRVHRGGIEAALAMKPPGVGAGTYALGVEQNFIARQLEASDAAATASRQSLYSGLGGLAGGEVASMVAAPVGAFVGGRVAGRLFGSGAAGAGKLLGGLAAGYAAYSFASEWIGDKINEDFAQIEQIRGVTGELGEIAGSGRNLSRTKRYDLGVAARSAAKDIGMDVQEMGDVLALGRQAGMLPTSTDPGKAREQFRDFARTIEEGAQILGSSLATATAVIKTASSQGMGAREGIIRAAGSSSPEAWLAQQQPSWLNQAYSAMAAGPVGTLQTMAALGGGSMAGMGLMDLPGAAMGGLAGGGDFLSGAAQFMVHQDQYLKGMGGGGRRTLAREQLRMGGELIESMMPELSTRDAQAFYAMNTMGLSGADARRLAGGGGSGRQRDDEWANSLVAMQGSMVAHVKPGVVERPGGLTFSGAIEGAMIGGLTGGPWGAAIGGIGSFVTDNWKALTSSVDMWGDDLKEFAKWTQTHPDQKADFAEYNVRRKYDARLAAEKTRLGIVDVDPEAAIRFRRADLSSARLDLDASVPSGVAGRARNIFEAAGLGHVSSGAGSFMAGGREFSASDVQGLARGNLWGGKPLTHKEEMAITMAASSTMGTGIDQEVANSDVRMFNRHYEDLIGGKTASGEVLMVQARELLGQMAPGDMRDSLVSDLANRGGVFNPRVRFALGQITGKSLADPSKEFWAGQAGAAAMKQMEGANLSREGNFLREAYMGRERSNNMFVPASHQVRAASLPASYYSELQSNPNYMRAKDLILHGKDDEAKTALHQATAETQVANREKYGAYDAPVIDPNARINRPGSIEAANSLLAVAQGFEAVSFVHNPAVMQLRTMAAEKALDTTTWAEQVRAEEKTAASGRKRRTGPGSMEHAIGFGEQESAMSSIQRSLRSTERALSAIEKKVAGMGANPQASAGTPTSGGKP